MGVKINYPAFTIEISKPKPKRVSNMAIRHICYAQAFLDDNGNFIAKVNTRGNEGYPNDVEVPFTEDSYLIKDKLIVWYKERDKYGHKVKVIRTAKEAHDSGNQELLIPISENYVFSGYLVNRENGYEFDLKSCIGHVNDEYELLTATYIKKEKEEDVEEE